MVTNLKELLQNIKQKPTHIIGNTEREIFGIEWDYQKVTAGTLYCCLIREEFSEKHITTCSLDFYPQAIENGATCLVAETDSLSLDDIPEGICIIFVENANSFMGFLAQAMYEYPYQSMKLIGVTGTNGKTSTSQFLDSILLDHGATPGVIGTIGMLCGDYREPSLGLSNPLANDLFRIGGIMKKEKADTCIMEVTSHGMTFSRGELLDFDVAIFTNFSQDHLDFHLNMEDYKQAKLELFRRLGRREKKAHAIINIDDAAGANFIEAIPREKISSEKVCLLTYGIRNKAADLVGYPKNMTPAGSTFHLFQKGTFLGVIELNVPGLFNIYNAIAAFATCYALGIPIEHISRGLSKISKIPGRFEKVVGTEHLDVYVDYAHTPDALENILKALRPICRGRLVCVFGCGGDRDREKRPIMREIAEKLADMVVITSDNPRTEAPEDIIKEILAGQPFIDPERHLVEIDRRKAIQQALDMSRSGDTILIAGKGHETFQIIGKEKQHFSDREEVEKYFLEEEPCNEISFRTWKEISREALRHNFDLFTTEKPSTLQFMSVVKDDGLGVGAMLMAEEAVAAGASGLCVSCLSEAKDLRNQFPKIEILILGERPDNELTECIQRNFSIQVQSLRKIKLFGKLAEKINSRAYVHLKIDTGMGRYGASPEEASKIYSDMQNISRITLKGIMTHFAQSDESDKTYAHQQWKRFQEALRAMGRVAPLPECIHACNTGAYLDLPEYHSNMVRIGILPTGVYPSKVCRQIDHAGETLKPVISLKTKVSFIRCLKTGESAGYGMHYTASTKTYLAVLPIGYGDGYPRLRNKGKVLINGNLCPIVGGVSLDAILVRLNSKHAAAPGDEVVLIGEQGTEQISMRDLADWAGTVVYDVMTRLKSERIATKII